MREHDLASEHIDRASAESRTLFTEHYKCVMNARIRENLPTLMRARCDEGDWGIGENNFEATKSLPVRRRFGGHRPPLQCAQSAQQLLVDIVEPAIAKNDNDISLFQ